MDGAYIKEATHVGNTSLNQDFGRQGFKVFLGIAEQCNLSIPARRILLGGIAPQTYYNWKDGRGTDGLSHDQLERLSLILGVWKALRLLFVEIDSSLRWLKAPNTDIPFSGQSPLNLMLRGSIDDLYSVRRYLDAWRGVWP